MSRIGKLPIEIPEGVTFEIKEGEFVASGPKGTLRKVLIRGIKIEKEGNFIFVKKEAEKVPDSIYGTARAILANMIKGVSQGWVKNLELVGAGYRAEVSGSTLILSVGYSHPVNIEAPEGVSFKVDKTGITIEGIDREVVGQISANIRAVRPPEPYKGKGIKYKDEVIRRKAGKAAKAAGAPA